MISPSEVLISGSTPELSNPVMWMCIDVGMNTAKRDIPPTTRPVAPNPERGSDRGS